MEFKSSKLHFGFDFNGDIEGEFGHAYGTARVPACFWAVEFQDEVREPVDHGGLPSSYSDATATDLRPGLGFGHRSLIQFRMVISE